MGLETIAMVGIAAASSLANSVSQAGAANKNAKAQSKAAMVYNQKIMAETSKAVTQLNLDRAQSKANLIKARTNIDIEKDQKQSGVNVQAGATGTVGATVQDAIKTVSATASLSTGDVNNQYMDAIEASNQQLSRITTQGQYDLQNGTKSQGKDIMAQGIWQAAGAGLGAWAGAELGKPTPAGAGAKDVPSVNNSFFDRFGFGGIKTTGSSLGK